MKQVSNNNIDEGRRDPRRNVSSLSRAISSAPPLPLYLSSVRSFFLFIQQDFHFSPPNAFTLFPVASVEDCKLLLSGACFISIIICSAFELSSGCGQGARTMQRKLIIIISARYFHWNNSYSRTVVFANARLAAPFCWPEHPFLLVRTRPLSAAPFFSPVSVHDTITRASLRRGIILFLGQRLCKISSGICFLALPNCTRTSPLEVNLSFSLFLLISCNVWHKLLR